ncbi:hypothetical protein XENORESO_010918 [Xenotaenia resolanae]|uniref:Uncharacterized protein n=1 Tax=Xenotaenia resolanae TaxID=208358 RepID=A0ABV0VYU5_9TELE
MLYPHKESFGWFMKICRLSRESLQTGIVFQTVTPDVYSDTTVTTKITNISTHYTNYLNSHFSKGSKSRFAFTQPLAPHRSREHLPLKGVWLLGLAFHKRDIFLYSFTSTPSSIPPFFPPSFFIVHPSLCVAFQHLLPEAAAARLVLLRINVVVNLELGLIWLLCGSVLQLPDREKEKEREGGRQREEVRSRGVDVWDGAQRGRTNQEYEKGGGRKKSRDIEILSKCLWWNVI